jgi:cytochrome c-type biogenesis protein CcmH
MTTVLVLIFAVLALLAAGFAVFPALRLARAAPGRRRYLLPAAVGLGVLLVGLGAYAVVGTPGLAVRALRGPQRDDYPSLIAALAQRMRDRPTDVQGWVYLARGYSAFGQFGEATKAYARAVALAKAQEGRAPADLLAGYGMALAFESRGVTPEAEAIFREALAADPQNQDARYHLGFAAAERGDTATALRFWEPLAPEAAPDAPWRDALIQQLALLKARPGGGQPPNIAAMVQGLATRLAANPDDLNGWLMLIRAYGVLGDKEKAMTALGRARTVFAADAAARDAIEAQAKQSGLAP